MPAADLSSPTDKPCFALLDDCNASVADPRSRLYTGYVRTLVCQQPEQFPRVLSEMQHALRGGLHAVGLFHYELGEQMHGLAARGAPQTLAQSTTQIPGQTLAQVLLFEHCERLSAQQVAEWLAGQSHTPNCSQSEARAGIAGLRQSVSADEFKSSLARIHGYLEAGDTYQVNYTYRLQFDAYGELPALYSRLRQRQAVPYGALIALPDGSAVLSLSPELFVRHQQGELTTCPMKGTAAASGDATQDAQSAAALAADPKGRAENVMIVDLLRNDLGRIAALGSVQVPRLFEVQRHGSVLQMTTTVTARANDALTLAQVFAALYPCGSVTGAPKHRTLHIIRELETTPRGIYTGAIGWFEPLRDAQELGDFCLSVPIRTLALQAVGDNGLRAGEMGVGAGIVYDSDTNAEYAECQLKAQFLTGLQSGFELFETMHATHANGCRHVDLHLRRLATSAAYFGFTCDEDNIRAAVRNACHGLAQDGAHRLRLALKQDGTIELQTAPLNPIAAPVRLLLAATPTSRSDLFLRHKTSVRQHYDAAWRNAEKHGAFDTLFCNGDGELTEGARSNLFLKLDGRWYTPPLSAGLLPGIMRTVLLADPQWGASERTLSLKDLLRADEIMVCNALRGALSASVDW